MKSFQKDNVSITIEVVKGGFILNVPVLIKDVDDDSIEDVIYETMVVSTPRKVIEQVKTALDLFKLVQEK